MAAIVALGCAALWAQYDFMGAGPLPETVTLVFPPATHFTTIADTLADNHVIAHPTLFKARVFLRGGSSKFKAGEYIFPEHVTARDVAIMMEQGKTVVHHMTIPEGLMTSEIEAIVAHEAALDGDITLDIKDGELLPETYNFSRGDKRNDLLMRMHHAMEKTLDEAWKGREDNLPFATPQQAVTLASIVEKETGLPSERPRVAAVYINRLKKGMLLQADPTTAYAVTMGKYKLPRPLTYDDLALKSPYNTYQTPGLPPGPIANPGKASILATLHPIQSDELYFVATGTGGHNFARTVEEHAINVQKYRQLKH
jgi:UPF0755 protein